MFWTSRKVLTSNSDWLSPHLVPLRYISVPACRWLPPTWVNPQEPNASLENVPSIALPSGRRLLVVPYPPIGKGQRGCGQPLPSKNLLAHDRLHYWNLLIDTYLLFAVGKHVIVTWEAVSTVQNLRLKKCSTWGQNLLPLSPSQSLTGVRKPHRGGQDHRNILLKRQVSEGFNLKEWADGCILLNHRKKRSHANRFSACSQIALWVKYGSLGLNLNLIKCSVAIVSHGSDKSLSSAWRK